MTHAPDSNTPWLEQLQDGKEVAVERLWKEYFHRIVRYASKKMTGLRLRAVDEEDVALSAMNSFCAMAKRRETPIADSTELWKILITITRRKVNKERQRQFAAKRQEFALNGESVFGQDSSSASQAGLAGIPNDELTPLRALELTETLNTILALPNADVIAEMRLAGHSNADIAEKLGCSTRTVQRNIEKMETAWTAWVESVVHDKPPKQNASSRNSDDQ